MNKTQDIKMRIIGENAASAAFRQVSNDLTGLTRRAGLAGTAFKSLGSVAIGAVAVQGIRKMIGVVTESIELAQVQIDAEKKVADIIRATGGAAGYTTEELKKMASAMQEQTKYGDEAILEMQSILLTFKNVSGSTFREASMAVLDMATVMQTDLKSAAIQLGKALNDPVLGATAMSRAGIQFTLSQKDMMKAMVETGDIAGAQRIILDELAGQMGGAAAGAAETYSGKIQQLKNRYGDMQEEIGKAVMESGAFDAVLEALNPSVAELTRYIANHKDDIGAFAVGLTNMAIGAGKSAAEISQALTPALREFFGMVDSIPGGWMTIMAMAAGAKKGGFMGALLAGGVSASTAGIYSKAKEMAEQGISPLPGWEPKRNATVPATIKPAATGSTTTTVVVPPTSSAAKESVGSSVVAAATGKGLPTTSDFDKVIESLKDEERQITMTSQEYKAYLEIRRAGVAEGSKEAAAIRQAIADNEELRQKYENLGTTFKSVQTDQDVFLDDLNEGISQWIGSIDYMFDDMAFGAKTTFTDILRSFGEMITQMIIQKRVVDPLLGAIGGGVIGDSGSYTGLNIDTSYTPYTSSIGYTAPSFADGGIMTKYGPVPLRSYASGGIATHPQVALYGEGSTPEAYVPLPDGRSIPVSMRGSQTQDIRVEIVNQSNEALKATTTSTRQDPSGTVLSIVIDGIRRNKMGLQEIIRGQSY